MSDYIERKIKAAELAEKRCRSIIASSESDSDVLKSNMVRLAFTLALKSELENIKCEYDRQTVWFGLVPDSTYRAVKTCYSGLLTSVEFNESEMFNMSTTDMAVNLMMVIEYNRMLAELAMEDTAEMS